MERMTIHMDNQFITIMFLCKNENKNKVIDHFGTEIKIEQVDGDHFCFSTEISLSPTFLEEVFQLEEIDKIIAPREKISEYARMMRDDWGEWDEGVIYEISPEGNIQEFDETSKREQAFCLIAQCVYCAIPLCIPIDPKDYLAWMRGQASLEEACSYLSVDEREFIISAICPECYNDIYNSEED